MPIPKVYTLPLADILVGVALERLAVPPLMEKAKSAASKAPLPPVALYTASENVTAIVELLDASATDEIVGGVRSKIKAISFSSNSIISSLPSESSSRLKFTD